MGSAEIVLGPRPQLDVHPCPRPPFLLLRVLFNPPPLSHLRICLPGTFPDQLLQRLKSALGRGTSLVSAFLRRGHTFDPWSGNWFDPWSGSWFDPWSGSWFDPWLGNWFDPWSGNWFDPWLWHVPHATGPLSRCITKKTWHCPKTNNTRS